MIFYLQIQKEFGPIFRDPSQAKSKWKCTSEKCIAVLQRRQTVDWGIKFLFKRSSKAYWNIFDKGKCHKTGQTTLLYLLEPAIQIHNQWTGWVG